ncbi:MAG TPA: ABC transporter permease subunit [Fimbriimonas sp.]|nr:ABC transporter permease subunit [Fimbriimonas sp.]
MEQAIFGQALREYLRPRRVIPWIMLGLICALLAYSWKFLEPKSDALHQYANVSSMLVFRIVALASAIFTTAIISQEVEQRTIVYLLTRPVARWKLLLIRYLASVLVVAVLGILAALFTSFGAFKTLGGNELLSKDILALVVGAFAYGALFLFVSLLFNRAMLVCLLFAFGWETSVPNMPGEMGRLSILTHLQAIAEHPNTQDQSKLLGLATGALGTNTISASSAWGVLGFITLICLGLSAWWFTHFEYVPREDAE